MTLSRLGWRNALSVVSLVVACVVWLTFTTTGGNPVDAWDFWVDPSRPYADGETHHYLYSPVFAQVISPFRLIGFEFYVAVSRALELVCAFWLAGPALGLALFLPPVATEINAANINLILVAAIALGFRWPAFWAIVLLTKPTMGVGLLWFVVRRDWRAVAIALGTTALVAGVSFALNPQVWFDYIRALQGTYTTPDWPFPYPIWMRLPVAVPLVLWGAFTKRPWAVALGSMLAAPRLYFLSPVMLLGLLPLMPKAGYLRRLREHWDRQDRAARHNAMGGREAVLTT